MNAPLAEAFREVIAFVSGRTEISRSDMLRCKELSERVFVLALKWRAPHFLVQMV